MSGWLPPSQLFFCSSKDGTCFNAKWLRSGREKPRGRVVLPGNYKFKSVTVQLRQRAMGRVLGTESLPGFVGIHTLSTSHHDKIISLSLSNLSLSQIRNSGQNTCRCFNDPGFCIETNWMQCSLNLAFLRLLQGDFPISYYPPVFCTLGAWYCKH